MHNILAFLVAGFLVYLLVSGNMVNWIDAASGAGKSTSTVLPTPAPLAGVNAPLGVMGQPQVF